MAMKIIAAADLHLGRRSTGLAGDAEILASKHAWLRLVQWAIDNRVDAVTLSGDVIDQDNAFFESIGPLQLGFERLGQAGIEVFLVSGNHDYKVLPSLMGDQYGHVHLLGKNGQWERWAFIRKGETVEFLGWSYPGPGPYVTTSPISLLSAMSLDVSHPVIGLLHADLDNINSKYCPVGQQELVGLGVGTWILGHIHKPGEWRLPGTSIYYPGSTQALSAKEPGKHGFLLISIDGGQVEIARISLSTVRYQELEIDITGANTREELWPIVMETILADARIMLPEMDGVKLLSYDLRLVGEHADDALVLKWADDSRREMAVPVGTGTTISVRSVVSAIRPPVGDLAELARQPSPAGALASMILAIRQERATPLLTALEEQWEQRRRQLRISGVYQPLLGTAVLDNKPDSAREYLLAEANRLLNQLLSQTQKAN